MSQKYNKDITGQKFGRLTAVSHSGKNKHNHSLWLCKCDCGNTKIVELSSLTKNRTRSCGCLDKEAHILRPNRKTHGMCGTRIHRIWKVMKNRCLNPNTPDYKRWYGGRGVTVCEEWKNSFQAFYEWAMANGYNDTLSIDRIDENGNYEPSNCRWADATTQARNTRQVVPITYKGETHCLAEWAEILNIPVHVLRQRKHHGWTIEKMFEQPVRGRLS